MGKTVRKRSHSFEEHNEAWLNCHSVWESYYDQKLINDHKYWEREKALYTTDSRMYVINRNPDKWFRKLTNHTRRAKEKLALHRKMSYNSDVLLDELKTFEKEEAGNWWWHYD